MTLTALPSPADTFGEWLVWDDEAESIREEAEVLHRRLNQLRDRYRQVREAQAGLGMDERAAA